MLEYTSDFFWTWPITAFAVAVATLICVAMLWSDFERRAEYKRRVRELREDEEALAEDTLHANHDDITLPKT